MKKLFKGGAIALALMPFIVLAQQPQADAFSILDRIAIFTSRAIPVLFAIIFAYFVYGVLRFVMAQDADKKKDARGIVIQSIIALFLGFSIWGIIGIAQRTIGTGSGGNVGPNDIPTITI